MPENPLVQFLAGPEARLSTVAIKKAQIIILTDVPAIHFDVNETTRVNLTPFVRPAELISIISSIEALQTGKVDNVEGKGLSTNDFTTILKTTYDGYAALITALQTGKVDKVEGYGLSQENYTLSEKEKLAALESSKFLGSFASEDELLESYPEDGEAARWENFHGEKLGCTADVTVEVSTGVFELHQFSYNGVDTWTDLGKSGADTAEMIKQKYESNPNTNAFEDAEKNKLAGINKGTANPLPPGTPTSGTSENYTPIDHVHPHDPTKTDVTTTTALTERVAALETALELREL